MDIQELNAEKYKTFMEDMYKYKSEEFVNNEINVKFAVQSM